MIKTNIQTGLRKDAAAKAPAFLTVVREIISKEGYSAFFTRGLSARLSNNLPASVLMIIAYEAAKKLSMKQPSVETTQ